MDNILSIDISLTEARASVLKVEERKIEVIESHSVALTPEHIRSLHSPASADVTDTEQNEEPADTPETEPPDPAEPTRSLTGLLESIRSPWSSSVAIIPPFDSTSLNIKLPFGDPRSLDKIIDMEVQDIVPFSTDEFLIQHHVVAALPNGTFEVHVTLIPKNYIRSVLQVFKECQLEPLIMSTPCAALEAAFHLAPEYLEEHSALVLLRDNQLHTVFAIGGETRVERVISSPGENGHVPDLGELTSLTDLKLTIASVEQTYEQKISKVYFIGGRSDGEKLRKGLGREVEYLATSDLIKGSPSKDDLAGISSVFVRDINPPQIITNFRTREFSYNPELKELFRGLKMLSPYFLSLIIALVLCAGGVYGMRAYREASLRSMMKAQIERVSTTIQLREGSEVASLRGQIGKLKSQLQHIGSAAKYSPLSSLLEISSILSRLSDKNFTELEIKGDKVKLKGYAPSHSHIRKMKEAFQKRKPVRCRIKKDDVSSSGGSRISFTFHIRCE